MYVIGTAGHVDHGKSTLVHALTGIDPDRLPEEKARSMTIDLGFAWLKLPNAEEVGVVDVPGHERFIKNMLAGVGGIDLALFVVAADEGVMPQTREHLAILDLLQVKKGVIALTKRDLVDDDWLELAQSDVAQAVKGTVLETAPIVAVSSYTREGLPELLEAIQSSLRDLPAKSDTGKPRLPIDRVFTVAGFGTVVTGTLLDGSFSLGQEVEIVPGGKKARIRGLQTHRKRIDQVQPGNRVAANLSGVAPEDVERGQVVTAPGWLRPTTALDARIHLMKDAPHDIKHNATVTFHTGASESTARVRLLEREKLLPGEDGWAQLRLDKAIPILKGDRFIIRSPQWTLGGGQVVEAFAKRHRRGHGPTLERLTALERGSPEDMLLGVLEANEPSSLSALTRVSNLPAQVVSSAMESLIADGKAISMSPDFKASGALFYSASGWHRTQEKTRDILQTYHQQFPLRRGAPKEELRSRLGLPAQVFGLVLARAAREGVAVDEESSVRLPGHAVRFSPEQQRQAEAYLRALEGTPYSPPTDSPADPELLNALVDQGKVVRVSDEVVFAASAYQEMTRRITEAIKARGKITVAEVRDLFGTSRKYALALMEHLDQQHVTRRVGDDRVLR